MPIGNNHCDGFVLVHSRYCYFGTFISIFGTFGVILPALSQVASQSQRVGRAHAFYLNVVCATLLEVCFYNMVVKSNSIYFLSKFRFFLMFSQEA